MLEEYDVKQGVMTLYCHNRNRVNNWRIAKDVPNVPGIFFLRDIGPHWPKMVREFMCNISVDIADPDNPMFHQGQLQASILSLRYVVLHKATVVTLVPTCNNTNVSEALGRVLRSCCYVNYSYEEEQQRLAVEIQVKKDRVSELKAKIQALKATVTPTVNDPTTTSIVVPAEPTTDAAETS
ncbi:hypothetical protein LIER_16397 [Lithospermum erythrorhizon]|uniref:Uncharacterized protein n=1 Tax=Lithospermum erythrorhizon TaxID=34254 RepID=A0AAV3Q6H9_LITER